MDNSKPEGESSFQFKFDKPEYFPVQAFFNAVLRDRNRLDVVNDMERGIGRGYDGGVVCTFPGELDEYETPFEGIEFSVGRESIILSEREFHELFQMLKGRCTSK